MFLNVRDMELRPLRFSRTYEPGEIDLLDANLRQTSPLTVEGKAELAQSLDEIRLTGLLKVTLFVDCDRCLEPYSFAVEKEFDLVYLPDSDDMRSEEKGLSDDDAVIAFYEGSGLELDDVLREQVILSLPMRKICREDCEGICPTCGENWNQRPCSCPAEPIDHRLEALQAWTPKN